MELIRTEIVKLNVNRHRLGVAWHLGTPGKKGCLAPLKKGEIL